MTEREIKRSLYKSFTANTPEFPEDILDQCSDAKGAVTDMANIFNVKDILDKSNESDSAELNRRPRKVSRLAIIAAVLGVFLIATVTAAAVNLSSMIDTEKAVLMAQNYVVVNETDPELYDQLSNAMIAGLVYDEHLGTGEVNLGLSAGRLVYNISFKTCGYEYNVVMDAKTGIVYSVDRDIDEQWEKMLPTVKEEADKRLKEFHEKIEKQNEEMNPTPKYSRELLRSRFVENFGLHRYIFDDTDKYLNDFHSLKTSADENARTADMKMSIDGYVYTATIDFDGNVLSSDVTEDENYDGERILHEKVEGIISFDEADKAALDAIYEAYPDMAEAGIEIENSNVTTYGPTGWLTLQDFGRPTISENLSYNGYLRDDGFNFFVVVDAENGDVLMLQRSYTLNRIIEKAYEYSGLTKEEVNQYSGNSGMDQGTVTLRSKEKDITAEVVIDAQTLDLISLNISEYTESDDTVSYGGNQELSNEAPDGYISEAVAATVALDKSGITENRVCELTVELDGDVYKIKFRFGYENYPDNIELKLNTYEIDAITGEILSYDAITPEDYITKEKAIEVAKEQLIKYGYYKADELADAEASAQMVNRIGSDRYEVTLINGEERIVLEIDALTGKYVNFMMQ